ncbi:MAG: TRAP transporter small permease [Planctomycetota bacterium]|jgi:TRAP-type C4-dicarboxylate transport system permease small subunit|nr:TRAP transporter small permease [Planctomycetota bacterium]
MKGIMDKLETASAWVTGVSMLVVIVSMLLQVTFRYVFVRPLAWTDTLCKFAFIWAVFFGAFIGTRKNMHVAVDMLPQALSRTPRLIMSLAVHVLVVAILLICSWFTFSLFNSTMTSTLPAVSIPLGYIYLPLGISSLMMIAAGADSIREAIRLYREGGQ